MAARVRLALVLGGAECVWDDYERFKRLARRYDICVAVNHIGMIWPHELHHWVSWHTNLLCTWIEQRRRNRLPDAKALWTGDAIIPPAPPGVRTFPHQGGSSGLLASVISLTLADLVVLAGVPMDPKMPHWHDEQQKRPYKDGANYHYRWQELMPLLKGRVRSMSGYTRNWLGEPTEGWLDGASFNDGVDPA